MVPVLPLHFQFLIGGKLALLPNEFEPVLGSQHISSMLPKLLLTPQSEEKHVSFVLRRVELEHVCQGDDEHRYDKHTPEGTNDTHASSTVSLREIVPVTDSSHSYKHIPNGSGYIREFVLDHSLEKPQAVSENENTHG